MKGILEKTGCQSGSVTISQFWIYVRVIGVLCVFYSVVQLILIWCIVGLVSLGGQRKQRCPFDEFWLWILRCCESVSDVGNCSDLFMLYLFDIIISFWVSLSSLWTLFLILRVCRVFRLFLHRVQFRVYIDQFKSSRAVFGKSSRTVFGFFELREVSLALHLPLPLFLVYVDLRFLRYSI